MFFRFFICFVLAFSLGFGVAIMFQNSNARIVYSDFSGDLRVAAEIAYMFESEIESDISFNDRAIINDYIVGKLLLATSSSQYEVSDRNIGTLCYFQSYLNDMIEGRRESSSSIELEVILQRLEYLKLNYVDEHEDAILPPICEL